MKLKDEFSGSILEVVEVDYKNGQVISTLVSGKIPPIGSLVVETWVNNIIIIIIMIVIVLITKKLVPKTILKIL